MATVVVSAPCAISSIAPLAGLGGMPESGVRVGVGTGVHAVDTGAEVEVGVGAVVSDSKSVIGFVKV